MMAFNAGLDVKVHRKGPKDPFKTPLKIAIANF